MSALWRVTCGRSFRGCARSSLGSNLKGNRGADENCFVIDAPDGAVAIHQSAGEGPAVVLSTATSSSSRLRQLEGRLGKCCRLFAVDLPGHGESDDAK